MMSVLKSVLVFFCIFVLNSCNAQHISLGSCPSVSVVQDFDAPSFLGLWYEVEKYFSLFEIGGTCNTATYGATDIDGVVSVVNSQISSLTNSVVSVEGTADLTSTTGEAKLSVTFSSSPVPAPYWVLDTDYDTYAVILTCVDLLVAHSENVWILTRERTPSTSTMEKAYAVLEANGLSTSALSVTDQTNC